jgi:1-acyl-sn-glycerol-3-phosphate acyltransferase
MSLFPITKASHDESPVKMWEPLPFTVGENYDYLKKGFFKTLWHYIFRVFAHTVLMIYEYFIVGVRIYGRKNIGNLRGAVIVCNHVHTLDCTFVDRAFYRHRVYYATLETNFKIPVVRPLITWLGGVPIPRSPTREVEFVKHMEEAVKDGDMVCMYPEGVLMPYCRNLRKFRRGAFYLAKRTGCPIIPVVVTFRKPAGLRALIRQRDIPVLNILDHIPDTVVNNSSIIQLEQMTKEVMQTYIDNH